MHCANIVPGHSSCSQDKYNSEKDKFPLSLKAPLNRIYVWVCCAVLTPNTRVCGSTVSHVRGMLITCNRGGQIGCKRILVKQLRSKET
jgi:hypothetical protein